jgi:hypothetical protein
MKKMIAGALAALATIGAAGGAGAQICAGFPTVDRQGTVGVSTQFPDGADFGDVWGVEGSYNVPGPLSVFGGLTVVQGGDANSWTAGAALELPRAAAALGSNVSICPLSSISYTDVDGLASIITIPLALGIGATWTDVSGIGVSPVIAPQVVYSRLSVDDDLGIDEDDLDEEEFNVGIAGNLIVTYRGVWAAGTVAHVFVDDAEPTFGIRLGFRL